MNDVIKNQEEVPEKLPKVEEKLKLEAPKLNWWEKRILEHAQPFNAIAHLVGFAFIGYGLWIHNWTWVIAGAVICFLGHLSVWIKK